ncbi:MAG TPA: hypothetical protein VM077_03380 [Candidatus Limnocylindrales bacterium]|nr:hypothetical protein [Candidatus Limnocylindrales bacterium]
MTTEARARNITIVSDIGQVLTGAGVDIFREVYRERKHELGVLKYSIRDDQVGLERAFSRLNPLPNAQEGVRKLREGYQFGGYYTVRPETAKQVGINWLKEHNFPEPENIHVCKDHKDKVRKILDDFILNPDYPDNYVALIDDNADSLLKAAGKLVEDNPQLRSATEKLILIGFGGKSKEVQSGGVHIATGIRTFSLASWEEQDFSALQENIDTLFALGK